MPCTWRAPARTPASELATAQPVSSWQVDADDDVVAEVVDDVGRRSASTSNGSEPPLVSHSTRWLAPFTTAASSTRSANSGLRL